MKIRCQCLYILFILSLFLRYFNNKSTLGGTYPPNLKMFIIAFSFILHPFLTEFGRYRYKTSPQGLKLVGDAYTHRTDLIIGDFPDHAKTVGDSLLWTTDIEKNFFRTCELLTKCSAQGVIFNHKKFQFSSLEVNFAGFLITATGIQPPPSFLENIGIFLTPKTSGM